MFACFRFWFGFGGFGVFFAVGFFGSAVRVRVRVKVRD